MISPIRCRLTIMMMAVLATILGVSPVAEGLLLMMVCLAWMMLGRAIGLRARPRPREDLIPPISTFHNTLSHFQS